MSTRNLRSANRALSAKLSGGKLSNPERATPSPDSRKADAPATSSPQLRTPPNKSNNKKQDYKTPEFYEEYLLPEDSPESTPSAKPRHDASNDKVDVPVRNNPHQPPPCSCVNNTLTGPGASRQPPEESPR